MDVLYFLKQEYEAIKAKIPALVGGDQLTLDGESLRSFLVQIELIVRVADELVLPEIADNSRRGIQAVADASKHTAFFTKIAESNQKTGRLGEGRRRDLASQLLLHFEIMEQTVLPKFRDEVQTQTREDLGLVAQDFKADVDWTSSGGRSRVSSYKA